MTISGQQAVMVEWMFIGVAFTAVSFRLYLRLYRVGAFSISDGIICSTFVAMVACTSLDQAVVSLSGEFWSLQAVRHENAEDVRRVLVNNIDHTVLTKLLQCWTLWILPSTYVLWGIKASVITFLYTVIPKSLTRLRISLHITAALTIISIILVYVLGLTYCHPITSSWHLEDPTVTCFLFPGLKPPIFIFWAFHIGTETFIVTIPFILIRNMKQLPRPKMIAACCLFGLGCLSVLVTGVRIAVNTMQAPIQYTSIVAALEQLVGIIVVCAPALKSVVLSILERHESTRTKSDDIENSAEMSWRTQVTWEGDPSGDFPGRSTDNLRTVCIGQAITK